jgi:rhodanese-related sulfurtransferase
MNLRRFLAEACTLVGLALACALVSNALAGKERKLTLPGDYPNATTVTARSGAPAGPPAEGDPAGPAPVLTNAVPPAPGPAVLPITTASAPTKAAPLATPAVVGAAAPSSGPASRPAPAPKPADSSADLLGRFPAHGRPFVEITGDAAGWLHARGALFLDARRSKDYASGHVAGARSFPVWESELVRERIEALVAEGRDGAQPVVLYCSGGDCEDSHMLAQMLFGAGFENLLVYRDGFPDWAKRGGAVATGGAA